MTDHPSDASDARGLDPAGTDLPEAARRRVSEGAFTSGLSVADFAACLQMGLEPVGFVQGYCVMQWQWYGMNSPFGAFGMSASSSTQRPSGYAERYTCPHGFVSNEHRTWGENFEQTPLEDAWNAGFATAYSRMMEETSDLGAHGVIGVVDSTQRLTEGGLLEFRIQGTAVKPANAPTDSKVSPWSTYLAGQRLTKLIEAGYAPVSVVATVSSVRVWAYCMTEYLTEGTNIFTTASPTGQEITQLVNAQMKVREIARERVRRQLGPDTLHGARMTNEEYEVGKGDAEMQCTLRGNRVRRFQEFEPLLAPRPTVRLS